MSRIIHSRYPFTSFPEGWFFLCYSADLKISDVKPLFLMGKHLVLFRDEDGIAVVFAAHCPHQGAHLGFGGKFIQNKLICPYHGWGFDKEGKCVIKSHNNKNIKNTDGIVSYKVCEVDNKIFFYNTIAGKTKYFLLPGLPEYADPKWEKTIRQQWNFKSHPQEIAENLVDAIHFETLHRTSYPKTTFNAEGEIAKISSTLTLFTKKGENKPARLESIGYGMGYWILKYSGIVDTIVVATITPIDNDYVNFNFEFLVNGDVELGKKFAESIIKEVDADIIIWENKVYRSEPLLGDEDGSIIELRKWCEQFYG